MRGPRGRRTPCSLAGRPGPPRRPPRRRPRCSNARFRCFSRALASLLALASPGASPYGLPRRSTDGPGQAPSRIATGGGGGGRNAHPGRRRRPQRCGAPCSVVRPAAPAPPAATLSPHTAHARSAARPRGPRRAALAGHDAARRKVYRNFRRHSNSPYTF